MMSNQDYREKDQFAPVTQSAPSRSSTGVYLAGVATGLAILGVAGGGYALYRIMGAPQIPTAIAPSVSAPVAPSAPAPTAPSSPSPAGAIGAAAAPSASGTIAPAATYQTQGQTSTSSFNVQVIDLKRISGNMLMLRMNLTNTGSAEISPAYDFTKQGAWDFNVGAISGVYVVDPIGQKKYEVVADEANKALASIINPALQPGETREVYVQFPAPPVTTQRLTVYFPKATAPIADVPITQ